MFSAEINKWIVIGVILSVIVGLLLDKIKASAVFFGGVAILLLTQVITPSFFLNSFGNESIAAIFLLIIITAGFKNNFDLIGWLDRFYKQAKTPRAFTFQLTTSVALLSSVMNNTPIVALMIPYVYQWSKKKKVSPSKLMIPLSYAAIMGGMITVIGTSTNLVLNGFLRANGEELLTLTDFLFPGMLVSAGGILFLTIFSWRILPGKKEIIEQVQGEIREYLVETEVVVGSPISGRTVTDAGLRNLDGIFLVEIYREGTTISPVEPNEILCEQDRLFFAGDTSRVIELIKSDNGLVLPKTKRFKLGNEMDLVEVVIPANSDLAGKSLKQIEFRENYDAAVIAIHRNGEKLSGKLGEIPLEFGDLLLLTTGENFNRFVTRSKDLYIVSYLQKLENEMPLRKKLFLGFFCLVLIAIFASFVSFFVGLVMILGGMIAAKMMTAEDLKKNVNLDLLVILGSAITLGGALIESGGASWMANHSITILQPLGPAGIVVGMFLLTLLLTSFVTNVAAVSIVFPIAFSLVHDLNLNPTSVYLSIAFAASAAFITPMSYQTNLMVYGPGNYKMKDFVKIGMPMTLIYAILSLSFIIINYI